ncbi:MAG: amino acid adenylation domain-containing protein, partial [Acidobacteria bacterium]|nr:amino acid adenylation domain-containing protein [Acidobacteriota bacterium]
MSSNPSLASAAFRLSAQQERAWMAQEQGVLPFAQCTVSVRGALVPTRLQKAVARLVERYEILRTVPRRQAGVRLPFQVIREDASFHFEQVEGNPSLEELCDRERRFLALNQEAPPFRVLLVSSRGDAHTLVLTLPALNADHATLDNLIREIAREYAGQSEESFDGVQYADLVEWQNELLAGEETKAGRDYWRQRTRTIDFGAIAAMRLPLEHAPEDGFRFAAFKVEDGELAVQVAALARRLETSEESVLLAAWHALLSRLLAAPRIAIGYECHGRRYEELTTALGPLARSLPVELELQPEMAFSALVEEISNASAEARNWQESFAWSQASETENPLLPFAFAWHDLAEMNDRQETGFSLERAWVLGEPVRLRLNILRRTSEMTLELHYDRSRLEGGAIRRIASYYANLIAGVAADAGLPLSRLPLLSAADRQQLVSGWNQTAAAYPAHQCLQQLFEQQAARTPERRAVRSGEQVVTYRELNESANQLAHYLRRQGVGPDCPVGLCVERSTEMMMAVMAILKAGGAYVPLNPDNPPARLAQQLGGAAALIIDSKFAPLMPAFARVTLAVDRDRELWAAEPKTNPECLNNPENLVYVIYTSGSTGVPKGVAVRHRNLVNYADFISKRLELEKYPEGLQFATVSTLGADLGNTSIYPSLISGGCLHIVGHEVATDSRQLGAYLEKYPVDVLKIVPSHLEALLDAGDRKRILPRKYLVLGGEMLTPKLIEKIEALGPDCEIFNHYGPTETTVGSLTLRLKEYDWKTAKRAGIPVGRPIQNTQAYVLDQNLEPVPLGVAGELYIAGAGVTAGYLGQAEKTAERFVQNPFSADASSRMYRTGDLVRFLEDGNIEFLGRGDDQVKVRGFRIELGEIEAALRRQPAVKQAVVVARENERGDKQLVAYVVAAESGTAADQFRAGLKQQLPDYMVPSAIIELPRLPLTPNGKVDRQRLPEPDARRNQKEFVVPRTATEEKIQEVWAEVLRREKDTIGAEDNFFELGGHSLLATQVISRLRRALEIELPLRTLFEAPTIRQLAREAETMGARGQPEIPPMVSVPRNRPLPLSFAQQRLWVLDRIEPQNSLYNIPRALRLKGNLDQKALADSLSEIVRRHESQRTTFAMGEGGQPVQIVGESIALDLPVIDLRVKPLEKRESAAREIAAREARTPFDLARGPLLRTTLLKLAADDHVLLLTMHHIVSDAWSAAIFMQELGALYAAYSNQEPSPLPELSLQYADYAVWQRAFLAGKVLEDQLNYWREHLQGAPPLLELPADRPRPAVRNFEGAHEPIPLDSAVTERLKAFGHEQNVTPFMIMLAGFNALLSRYSGQQHIVLGTDIANRTTPETERMIGFFINLLPLHTDLSGDPTFGELVARVREVALGAYAHQDIPFDKLVEDLQPERSRSHNPIVQALFVMQNIPPQRRGLAGLELVPFPMPVT